MNNQKIENKIRKDVDEVKKDMGTLTEDSAARFSRFEESISKVADKAKDGASQMSEEVEKKAKEARETMVDVAETVKKDVGDGLSHYNAKAQELADSVPGNLGKNAAKYPWVAIAIGFMTGLLMGGLLKPSQRS